MKTRRHEVFLAPVTDSELNSLIDDVRPNLQKDDKGSQEKGVSDLFWLHDTKVMGWEEKGEPARVAY